MTENQSSASVRDSTLQTEEPVSQDQGGKVLPFFFGFTMVEVLKIYQPAPIFCSPLCEGNILYTNSLKLVFNS